MPKLIDFTELENNEISWKATLYNKDDIPLMHLYRKEESKTLKKIEDDIRKIIDDFNHGEPQLCNGKTSIVEYYTFTLVSGELVKEDA